MSRLMLAFGRHFPAFTISYDRKNLHHMIPLLFTLAASQMSGRTENVVFLHTLLGRIE